MAHSIDDWFPGAAAGTALAYPVVPLLPASAVQAAIQRILARSPGLSARRLARELRDRGWPTITAAEVRALRNRMPDPAPAPARMPRPRATGD